MIADGGAAGRTHRCAPAKELGVCGLNCRGQTVFGPPRCVPGLERVQDPPLGCARILGDMTAAKLLFLVSLNQVSYNEREKERLR